MIVRAMPSCEPALSRAVSSPPPERYVVAQGTIEGELDWQLAQLSADARAALRQLPLLGEDSAGPLGAGLLSSGV